jgi:hypothetical protein
MRASIQGGLTRQIYGMEAHNNEHSQQRIGDEPSDQISHPPAAGKELTNYHARDDPADDDRYDKDHTADHTQAHDAPNAIEQNRDGQTN